MSIQYKFRNTINYDAVKFDGVTIPVCDLKKIIIQQKKLGDSDVQIENEETGQIYNEDQQIPKNTHLVVVRVPFANPHKRARMANNSGNVSTQIGNNRYNNSTMNRHNNGSTQSSSFNLTSHYNTSSSNYNKEALELVTRTSAKSAQLSEEEKLKQIQSQSTKDFEPTSKFSRTNYRSQNYQTPSTNNNNSSSTNNGQSRPYQPRPHNVPGPNYTCRRCGIPGHYKQDCKAGLVRDKRASGIPKAFMRTADAKDKGALLTATGEYAVPLIDDEAYKNPKIEKAPFFEDEGQDAVDSSTNNHNSNREIPDCLKCGICDNLLVDAVITADCCKNIFCDNCIRTSLIESDMHECPSCHKLDVSPDSLMPSSFHRRAVIDKNSMQDPMDLFLNQLSA